MAFPLQYLILVSNHVEQFFSVFTAQNTNFSVKECGYIKLADKAAVFDTAPHSSQYCTRKWA